MASIRTILLVILWVGLMAGVGSAVLDGKVAPILLGIGVFIMGCLLMAGMMRSDGDPKPSGRQYRRQYRYKGTVTKTNIRQLRRDYDADQIQNARAVGADFYFDSQGYKRNAYSGDYMYMNSKNTPNKDVFADWEGKEIEYDGGEVYSDEDGNFWRDV